MNKKHLYYLLHIMGGVLFLSIPIILSPNFSSPHLWEVTPFRQNFFSYSLLLAFFYCNYLYLIPKFYFTGRRPYYFILCAVWFLIILYAPALLISGVEGLPKMRDDDAPGGMPHDLHFIRHMEHVFQFMLVFFLSLLLKVNNRLTNIQSEKLRAEVSYLKAQINPHFLFNTLNGIYALALEKSDETANAILKLSGMMRYVVTESTREDVPLNKEIEYITNYIELQKLRMNDYGALHFAISGNPLGKNISPLLLIPFIENAFKYGINPDGTSEISINIFITDKELSMNVRNKKSYIIMPDELKSGQGIENTKQLLLYKYNGKHNLAIFDTAETYEVALKINLV